MVSLQKISPGLPTLTCCGYVDTVEIEQDLEELCVITAKYLKRNVYNLDATAIY